MNYTAPDASAIEESNALALAIVPSESGNISLLLLLLLLFSSFTRCFTFVLLLRFLVTCVLVGDVTFYFAGAAPTFNSGAGQAKDFDPSGWELALVTTPSSNISSVNERQLVGCACAYLFVFYISFYYILSMVIEVRN